MMAKQMNIMEMVLRPFFFDLSIVLLLISPLLTMRLYAEERKTGTMELLFTYPLSDRSIVLAKFAAVVSAFAVIMAGTLPGIFLLNYLGNPTWKPILCGYLGVLLLGSSFMSLGIFTSSLTQNQIIAAVLSFGALLMLWVIGWAKSYVGVDNGRSYRLPFRYQAFRYFLKRGPRFQGPPLLPYLYRVFPLSYAEADGNLPMARLKERNIMAGRSKHSRVWTYGSSAVLSSLFFLGILAFLALIAERHPWRVDMTESGAFTLSEQTRNILNSLEQPIDIKAFYATASPEQTKAKDLLETYRYASRQGSTMNSSTPTVSRKWPSAMRSGLTGPWCWKDMARKQTIQNADEESLTNAILKLSRNEQKRIYFLMGHGEHSIEKS